MSSINSDRGTPGGFVSLPPRVISGKRVLPGEEVFRYDPGHYLIFTVGLPVAFRVEEASEERPYFGLRLDLDPALVASVMMEAGAETRKGDA